MTAEDETRINTGYGPLDVPNSLLRIWNKWGWPDEDVMRGMAEAGSVEADTRGGSEPAGSHQ